MVAAIWRRGKAKPISSYLTPDAPRDTVILHQYGASPMVPSISPFVMKLETYLRAAKIPYMNKFSRKPGPKGKLPWIQYNDKVIPDSQFCIEFLNAEMKVDLNKNLVAEELAIGHLVRRTVEESLYWILLMFRLVFEAHGTIYQKLGLPRAVIWYLRSSAKGRLYSQGIGRHNEEEVTKLMVDDLRALSTILGQRKFLFGNEIENVTEFDCALFGQLCQMVWQMPGCNVEDAIAEKYPNLVQHCERMKAAFWPDWDQRLLAPKIV
ncbi:failed axon connections [Biomphalaria pfeifferi]|uniref:Failed axon connections n=1 Tax=Biomphalaria pfeifferi TaxID=112525 RepID=A0AAD8AT84_BIOPF|nr:failed axon connections [Biomphalaria pfeifferi]